MAESGLKSAEIALRAALRQATGEAHEALHHHSGLAGLISGTLDRRGYACLMQRLWSFYRPLDRAVAATLAADRTLTFDYVGRGPLLARDLDDLDVPVPAGPTCREAAALVTPATLGGVLYVVEGAALGGALLDRAAMRLLGPAGSAAGRRYWAWCRSQGKHRWPMTLRFIVHLQSLGHSLDDIRAGAEATFGAFGRWLAPLDDRRPVPMAGGRHG